MPSKLQRALWAFVFPGQDIYPENLKDYVKTGYNENPTIFGAANKLASKAAAVRLIPIKNGKELEYNPIELLFQDKKTDYTLKEHRKFFHLFRYLLGEAIMYAPRLSAGNDKGAPMVVEIMPPQLTRIESGGVNDVIRYYKIDGQDQIPLDPYDVHHSRAFLNPDFTDGENFRGLSPLKVAANIIKAMNAGDKQTADLYSTGMPPFMLVNEDLSEAETEEQKKQLEKAWRAKSKDVPILGGGKIKKIDLGFSSMKDMQIVETDKRGLKIICNIWGIHESLFSAERATMDNMTTARKLMYEDRILPDVEDEIEIWNNIFSSQGITFLPDTDQIPALQEDREKLARIYAQGIQMNAVTGDEFRQVIGLDPLNLPEFGVEGLIERTMMLPSVPGEGQQDE